jgi:hypothetical protein
MVKFGFSNNACAPLLIVSAIFVLGCSQQPSEALLGIWRSEKAVAGKNFDGSSKF